MIGSINEGTFIAQTISAIHLRVVEGTKDVVNMNFHSASRIDSLHQKVVLSMISEDAWETSELV